MITTNGLRSGDVITILAKTGMKRFHQKTGVVECTKIDGLGHCPICVEYIALWKQSETLQGSARDECQNSARKIKPYERYYFRCLVDGVEETLSFGKALASKIGDETGAFRYVQKFKARFPCYDESRFLCAMTAARVERKNEASQNNRIFKQNFTFLQELMLDGVL